MGKNCKQKDLLETGHSMDTTRQETQDILHFCKLHGDKGNEPSEDKKKLGQELRDLCKKYTMSDADWDKLIKQREGALKDTFHPTNWFSHHCHSETKASETLEGFCVIILEEKAVNDYAHK